jgi:hypothetical protein
MGLPNRSLQKYSRRPGLGVTAVMDERELESLEYESAEGLAKALKVLSFLPHQVEVKGKAVALKPALMDPGIYDGAEKYKVSSNLQQCLMNVMSSGKYGHIKVALVDLTRGAPQFAGFYHKTQVFIASVAKVAPMLAAFQLQQDLRVARSQKNPKNLTELFDLVRDDWAASQNNPGGTATSFSKGVSLRGKLVLVNGSQVRLTEPKAPQLSNIFKVPGSGLTINFSTTGENLVQLKPIVKEFNDAIHALSAADDYLNAAKKRNDPKLIQQATTIRSQKRTAVDPKAAKIRSLGFWERMGIMVGGDVPASNFATSTVVGDLGYHYIASTLMQTGLYDTNRNGGLWIGADYGFRPWRGALAGGDSRSATAGSLAAFMTLLVQRQLVSPAASDAMRLFMQKMPYLPFPGTGSWFWTGLHGLGNSGSLKTVLAKVGLAGGSDDFAFIEREIDLGAGKKVPLRYIAVGLRARNGSELQSLILELDKCVLANNGLTAQQGGHP